MLLFYLNTAIPYLPDDLDFEPMEEEEYTAPSGKYYTIPSIDYKMVYIPPGEFMMGSPESEKGRYSDEKLHRVRITRGFYMGITEVTQAQWKRIMGDNPSFFKACDACPVENVSWWDVQKFIQRLNEIEGTNKSRLPTEAEWEYACRGGTQSENYKFSGSNNMVEVAWSDMSFTDDWRTHPVGTKKANELGIYDMSGNVCEWCWDWYAPDYYRKSPSLNPCGPSIGIQRVARGGTWSANKKKYSRCANRIPAAQFKRNEWDGLRLCKSK